MPKVKTKNAPPPPEGWDLLEPTLRELDARMRDVEAESHEGKRKSETVWPIFRLHHQRSRFIWEAYSHKHMISRELYDYCVKEGYADANLIAKWKKAGYERLCCLRCVQSRDTNFGTACKCRVPRSELPPGEVVECVHCGCRGCATGDEAAAVLDLRAGNVIPLQHQQQQQQQSSASSSASSSSREVGASAGAGGRGRDERGPSSSSSSSGAYHGDERDAAVPAMPPIVGMHAPSSSSASAGPSPYQHPHQQYPTGPGMMGGAMAMGMGMGMPGGAPMMMMTPMGPMMVMMTPQGPMMMPPPPMMMMPPPGGMPMPPAQPMMQAQPQAPPAGPSEEAAAPVDGFAPVAVEAAKTASEGVEGEGGHPSAGPNQNKEEPSESETAPR